MRKWRSFKLLTAGALKGSDVVAIDRDTFWPKLRKTTAKEQLEAPWRSPKAPVNCPGPPQAKYNPDEASFEQYDDNITHSTPFPKERLLSENSQIAAIIQSAPDVENAAFYLQLMHYGAALLSRALR